MTKCNTWLDEVSFLVFSLHPTSYSTSTRFLWCSTIHFSPVCILLRLSFHKHPEAGSSPIPPSKMESCPLTAPARNSPSLLPFRFQWPKHCSGHMIKKFLTSPNRPFFRWLHFSSPHSTFASTRKCMEAAKAKGNCSFCNSLNYFLNYTLRV